MNCNSCGSDRLTRVYKAEFGYIMMCENCGLVFRDYSGERRNIYARYDRMLADSHIDRFKHTVKLLSGQTMNTCLDIGSGSGDFIAMLKKAGAGSCTAIEPSQPLVDGLAKRVSGLTVFNGYVDDFAPTNGCDLITALGCHYLFKDHSSTLKKIARLLNDDGVFYFDGNAFVDTRSFVGKTNKVCNTHDLFDGNPMLNWWFTENGLGFQVEKYFEIVREERMCYGGAYFLGLLCKKREVRPLAEPTHNVEFVKMTLNKLGVIL